MPMVVYNCASKMRLKKAVVLAAGYGTRFLPVTKSIPKEMLPVVDKPIVQIIFVISSHKRALEDHFNPFFELEYQLAKAGKKRQLGEIKKISSLADFVFVRQKEMAGTGDGILTAQPALGREPFLLFWGDDFIVAKPSRARQLIKAFEKYQACILGAVKTTDPQDGGRYGFAVGKEVAKGVVKVEKLVEKPGVGKAPSRLAIVSGFVFTPEIFDTLLLAKKKIKRREIHYNIDGLNPLIKKEPVYALELKKARYYDTGNKLEYLKAVVSFGLKHPETKKEFKRFLRKLK